MKLGDRFEMWPGPGTLVGSGFFMKQGEEVDCALIELDEGFYDPTKKVYVRILTVAVANLGLGASQ